MNTEQRGFFKAFSVQICDTCTGRSRSICGVRVQNHGNSQRTCLHAGHESQADCTRPGMRAHDWTDGRENAFDGIEPLAGAFEQFACFLFCIGV